MFYVNACACACAFPGLENFYGGSSLNGQPAAKPNLSLIEHFTSTNIPPPVVDHIRNTNKRIYSYGTI